LSEPFLYHTLCYYSPHRVRALADAIIDPALRTAWKVSSWTRNIQLPWGVRAFLHYGEDSIAIKDSLTRIASCACKLTCLGAVRGVDIPPEILAAIACGLQDLKLSAYQRTGWQPLMDLSHLGRFSQLRRLEFEFETDDGPYDHNHDQDDDNDDDDNDDDEHTTHPRFLTSLASWNMPQLSSLDIALCFDDYEQTRRVSFLFPKRFAIFLSHCQLPALRRVALRLIYLPEMPVFSMTKALSTFFLRHQDLDHVVLSGFRAHVAHVLSSVSVAHLSLDLFNTPALSLGSLIHSRVQVLRMDGHTQDSDHETLSYTTFILQSILERHVTLRVVEIIRWRYADHELRFDGGSFSWIKSYDDAPSPSQIARDTCEREIRRLASMLAKEDIALRMVVEL
jgi:hypothetical protein